MRQFNRVQRRLRVVVEQTFGIIKQWGIVSNQPWRADVDVQGLNFILSTQLTTWLMGSRNTYPRQEVYERRARGMGTFAVQVAER